MLRRDSTPQAIPAEVRGVFSSDGQTVLHPPPGAVFREIVDHSGRVIAAGWVIPELADHPAILRNAYQMLDDVEAETIRLRLVE